MNAREKAAHVLGSVAEMLKMEGTLALDDNDQCVFTVDQRYVFMMEFDEKSEHLLINMPLGILPEGEAGKTLALEMLAGNYCWGLTAGGTLGLDDQRGIISLCYGFDVSEGKGGGIDEVLGDLVGAAEHWMDKLGTNGDSAGAPAAPAGGSMLRI